jgi:hypothetical protein
MKSKWLVKCKRQDSVNILNSRICSEHFKENDYERDLKSELMGVKNKSKLKESAIPSLHLPTTQITECSNKRKQRAEGRASKKYRMEYVGK